MIGVGWRGAGAAGVVGLLLLGCGSSATKTDGGGGGSGCAAYANKFCAEIQACAPGWLQIAGYGDLAGCQRSYLASCNASLTAPGSAWTAALAEQCGDAYTGMSCSTFLGEGGIPTACLVRDGTAADGAPCSTPWQCKSGRCSLTTIGSCGTCVPVAPLGQPCTPNEILGSSCANDLVCALTPASVTTPVCAMGAPMGGACADTAVCPVDGYCEASTHVCTKLPGVGQSCDASQIYYCDPKQTGALCDATTSMCLTISAPDGGCGPDGGGGSCTPATSDGGTCAPADICNVASGCFDFGACTNLVCAGGVDAAASPAAAVERTAASRLRRPPLGRPPGSQP
jgi:hypothetical protein